MQKMKIRIVKFTPQFLIELLEGKVSIASSLPSDAELLDLKLDLFTNQVQAIVGSDSFTDVADYPIPELSLVISGQPKATAKPVAAVKPQTRVEPKVASMKIAKPASTPQASKAAMQMENEFSPEQRKVLNFTVKGNVVVVKPIQFLKGEWDDINEVVRSLGGKWVKGDIISYWEIPAQ